MAKYIGSSRNIVRRFVTHRYNLNKNSHGNSHLQAAWNKYKFHACEFVIVEECEEKLLAEKEDYYIINYNTMNHSCGYNFQLANRPFISPELLAKFGATWVGRKHTEESKSKMRDAAKGRISSPQNKKSIKKANTGRKHTEEAKQKMKKSWAKRSFRNNKKGRKHTEESKQKMKDAWAKKKLLSSI